MTNENLMLMYYAMAGLGIVWGPFVFAPRKMERMLGKRSSDNIITILSLAILGFMIAISCAEFWNWYIGE